MLLSRAQKRYAVGLGNGRHIALHMFPNGSVIAGTHCLYAVDIECDFGLPFGCSIMDPVVGRKRHHKFHWNERRRRLGRIKEFVALALTMLEATTRTQVYWMPVSPKQPEQFFRTTLDPLEPGRLNWRRLRMRAHSTNRQLLVKLHSLLSDYISDFGGSIARIRMDHNPALFELEPAAESEES